MADEWSGIVDEFAKPIKRATIAQLRDEISRPGAMYARPPFSGHLAFGMDPEQLGGVVRASDEGSTLGFMTLAEEIEELYPHYAAVLSKRKRVICQLPITVEAAGDGSEEKKHAQFVTDWLDTGCLQDGLFNISDAIGKGYSVSEIIWDVKPGATRPKKLAWRTPRWFEISWNDGETIWLRTERGFDDLMPHKFLVHRHPYKSGLVIRSGLARPVVFLWMYAAYTQRDWALFSQGYGLPLRLGRYGPSASEDDKRVLWRAVSSIAGDVAAIVPESMKVEFVEAKASTNTDLFLKRADWLDRSVSKLVLGGTAGTDAISGGHAVGKEHREVEEDVTRFDAGLIGTSVTRQIVPLMIQFNFGEQPRYPVVRIGRPDEVPVEKVIAAVGDLGPLGFRVKASQIREKLQLDEPAAGDELVGGAPPAPVPSIDKPSLPIRTGAPSGLNATLMSRLLMAHAPEAVAAVDALTARMAQDAASALGGLQETIRAQFEQATDLPDLADRLSKLKLDPAAFSEAMARGMALAHLVGQADLLDEIGGVQRPAAHAAMPTAERDDLPPSAFAVPGKRKLLITDEKHVRLAWDMVDQTDDLTPAEKRQARRRILVKAEKLGLDTSDWENPS